MGETNIPVRVELWQKSTDYKQLPQKNVRVTFGYAVARLVAPL
jgi:hypothetical protein